MLSTPRRRGGTAALALTVAAVLGTISGCGGGSASSGAGGGAAQSGGGASSTVSSTRVVTVQLTNDGCAPSVSTVHSGPLTFQVRNVDATAVNELELRSGERIVGEKENLAPGFSGNFSLNLDAGTYALYCPGASTENSSLRVVGTAPSQTGGPQAALRQGTAEYASYVNAQVAQLVRQTRALDDAVHGGSLTQAQQAYAAARPFYERIEPVAESFTTGTNNLDNDIDARINDVPRNQWEGFHRIERGLFAGRTTAGLSSYASGLLANVEKLQRLTAHLSYQPAELANGAVSLLDEVSKTKITGEEERYSHLDVLDIQANVEGSEQAFADIEPALKTIDPQLASTVSTRFAAVDSLLNHYRDPNALGGFVSYRSVKPAQVRVIAQDVQAVAEPLSQVAAKVVAA